MTSAEFAQLYTLSQAAPGPNFMYVTLLGWQLAVGLGALMMTLAVLLPTITFSLVVGRLNQRHTQGALGRVVSSALAPITIGLMCASSTILIRAVSHDWRGYLLASLTVVVVLRTRWNPLLLLAAGAFAGIFGLV